jgi:hypothetical protein
MTPSLANYAIHFLSQICYKFRTIKRRSAGLGGYGSGRSGGRPTADLSLQVDIAWMIRTGRARLGSVLSGSLSWSYGRGEPAGSISYKANMVDCYNSRLTLNYTCGSGDDKENVEQVIRVVFTEPHYGGKRWWMVCPFRGIRVGKLYLPSGGDRFASRKAWRLGYHSQRAAHRERQFEKLFRLQKKLGGECGWEAGLKRPKGMWYRTYEKYFERYMELEGQCAVEMMGMLGRFLK